jgi:hypothetical protein
MTGGEGVKMFLRMAFEAAGPDLSYSREMESVETALETVERLNERYARSLDPG